MHEKQIKREGGDREIGNNIDVVVRKFTVISRNSIYVKIGANTPIYPPYRPNLSNKVKPILIDNIIIKEFTKHFKQISMHRNSLKNNKI